jgi:hypothetical protein
MIDRLAASHSCFNKATAFSMSSSRRSSCAVVIVCEKLVMSGATGNWARVNSGWSLLGTSISAFAERAVRDWRAVDPESVGRQQNERAPLRDCAFGAIYVRRPSRPLDSVFLQAGARCQSREPLLTPLVPEPVRRDSRRCRARSRDSACRFFRLPAPADGSARWY